MRALRWGLNLEVADGARRPVAQTAVLGAVLGADLRALAALRVGLGALVLGDVLTRLPDLPAFYGDHGVLPRYLALEMLNEADFSLHLAGGTGFAAVLFALHAVAALALLLGFRTRLAAFACWVLTVSLQHRNLLVLQGGDDLLRVLLFWAQLVPLGARWSLDALADPEAQPPRTLLCPGTAALLLQVAFMYWFTYVHKFGWEWETGSSIYWALSHDHFGRPWAQALLLPHPALLRALTRATYAFELWGPALLFCPFLITPVRLLCIGGFWALQLGMGATMNLAHFPLVSSVAMLPFVPPAGWDWLARRAPSSLLLRLQKAGSALGARSPRRLRWKPRFLGQAFALALLPLVFAANVAGLDNPAVKLPRPAELALEALALDQQWTMFAPGPAHDSGWFVFPGLLADGREVDLVPVLHDPRAASNPSWVKPPDIATLYGGARWLDYLGSLLEGDESLSAQLAAFLCAGWNAAHPRAQALKSLRLVYVNEPAVEPGEPRPRSRRTLWEGTCDD